MKKISCPFYVFIGLFQYFFLCLAFQMIPSLVSSANAQIFNVSTTAQFRTALENATVNGEDDTIILAAGTYKTTDDGLGTFTFVDTEVHNLTIKAIDGLTANDVVLDGDNAHQVLSYTNTQHSTLTLDRVSVKNGNSTKGGGIIANNLSDDLIVTNCVISDNTSVYGGGIYSNGNLTVTESTISGNSASSSGGGIYFYGDGTVTNSTISGNSAVTGGGIFIYYSFGDVTVTNSTISGNSAFGGGGIWHDSDGTLTITNSTISGNSASSSGGGMYGRYTVITNSTISGNTVSGNTVSSRGGGFDGGFLIMTNSTISGNSAVTGGGISCYGTFVNNIFSSNSSDIYFVTNIVSNVWNNYIDYTKLENDVANVKKNNIQPSAGSLNFADASFRLGVGSIAIDKGLDPNSTTFASLVTNPTTLQTVRDALVTDKDGNPRIVGSAIDLGAYEYSPYNLSISEDGSGSGRVISHPDGINCGSGNSDCFASFPMNTIVSLETIPDTGGSIFSGWSGDADCSDGQITVSSPISCTASFALCDTASTAQIGTTPYGSIGLAYASASLPPNDVIQIIATNQEGPLDFNGGKTVTLDGGYNCAFTFPPSSMTTITGSVTVSSGTVIFSNIRIQ